MDVTVVVERKDGVEVADVEEKAADGRELVSWVIGLLGLGLLSFLITAQCEYESLYDTLHMHIFKYFWIFELLILGL